MPTSNFETTVPVMNATFSKTTDMTKRREFLNTGLPGTAGITLTAATDADVFFPDKDSGNIQAGKPLNNFDAGKEWVILPGNVRGEQKLIASY